MTVNLNTGLVKSLVYAKYGSPSKARLILSPLGLAKGIGTVNAERAAKIMTPDPLQKKQEKRLSISRLVKGKSWIGERARISTKDQPQSPLFKLPAELRVLIWEEVVGNQMILLLHHLTPARLCSGKRPIGNQGQEKASDLPSRWSPSSANSAKSGSLLPLLLTCRRM
jgi:hypothetical protein